MDASAIHGGPMHFLSQHACLVLESGLASEEILGLLLCVVTL
jgi:hypothetical protein